jgi:hypothetical protein
MLFMTRRLRLLKQNTVIYYNKISRWQLISNFGKCSFLYNTVGLNVEQDFYKDDVTKRLQSLKLHASR